METEMEELIIKNRNLIYSLTHYFSDSNKEDLFQVGVMGIIKAYNNFKDDMGTKFTTYAYPYILGEMKKYVRTNRGVKISKEIISMNLKIEKAHIILTQKLNREPSTYELASFLEIPEYFVIEALKSNATIQSIDEPLISKENDLCLHDLIADKKNISIDQLIDLRNAIESLNNEEKKLVLERYMNDRSQSETANLLGISQVQVSRKEQKVLTKLKDRLI